jgi:large subunit ribosomal protein L32e
MRRKIKGWPSTVNVGYRGPKAARGIHPSGYEEVLVHNAEELKGINPKTQAVRIAHAISKRTRAKILVEARKKKIKVLNPGEVEEKVEEKREEQVTEEKEEKPVEKKKPKSKRKKAEKREGRKKRSDQP